MLKAIKTEELLFSGNIEDDRTNTFLNLDDYDWMNYKLTTKFKTKEQGILEVCFEYFGMITSSMTVTQKQTELDKGKNFVYSYPSDIFMKYLKEYLTKHMESWDTKYAFNGEEIVISFYNEVIHIGNLLHEENL